MAERLVYYVMAKENNLSSEIVLGFIHKNHLHMIRLVDVLVELY